MNETINGILIGSGITLVTALVTIWLNQKGETRRFKKQLKHLSVQEEINDLKAAFDKFKEEIGKFLAEKRFSIEIFSEILSLYPEEIRKEVLSFLASGLSKKEIEKIHDGLIKIFGKMSSYIVKRKKEIIDEI